MVDAVPEAVRITPTASTAGVASYTRNHFWKYSAGCGDNVEADNGAINPSTLIASLDG